MVSKEPWSREAKKKPEPHPEGMWWILSSGTNKETKKEPEKEVKCRDSRGIFGVNTPQKPINLPLSHLQKQRITPLLGAVQGRVRALLRP